MNTEAPKCAVCKCNSSYEVCPGCNEIYLDVLGVSFDTEAEIKDYMENEDIPARTLKTLGREFSAYLYGGD